jgi:hypothetical protein
LSIGSGASDDGCRGWVRERELRRGRFHRDLESAAKGLGLLDFGDDLTPLLLSDIAGNRTQLRRLIRQIYKLLIQVAPSPTLGWIVALYDGMASFMEMSSRVSIAGLIAAAHLAALPTQS